VSGLRRLILNIVELYEYFFREAGSPSHQGGINFFKDFFKRNTHTDGFYKFSWKDKNKISTKTFLSNFSKETTSHHRVSKDKPSISTLKSPTKTSSTKCFNV